MRKSQFHRLMLIVSTIAIVVQAVFYLIEPLRTFSFKHEDLFTVLAIFVGVLVSGTLLLTIYRTIIDKNERYYNVTILIMYTGLVILRYCYFSFYAYIGQQDMRIYLLRNLLS